ncbi:molybdopterin-containing oxidoreductase family protein [Derxia gummosa]|uniref:Molybdopterin-containing oxidoreductase family protein n=1 Tax=Derxia gummosa DSM 723 TaxID=1121388 RepID=A0A8B6X8S2_9BURK|nr:molybdopterin oxidoreductase family protein [Derxia gummosa]
MNAPADPQALAASGTRIVRAACPHDCPDTCALRVEVKDGVAVRVTGDPDHPTTRGALCTKVSRYEQRTYHRDRVLHPLRRVGAKGEGRFERATWDEALDAIAARLKAIAARDPEAILPYSYAGTMGLVQGESMAGRFFNKLGAARLDRTICSAAGTAGIRYTLGDRIGPDMEAAVDAGVIVFWGTNAIASNLHFWTFAQEAKRRGALLVAVDPYRSLTADKCALHIAPLPGTDSALALGVMHVLIREGWLDHDYIARHTLGFEQLAPRAAEFPPERVAELCGITAQEVQTLAAVIGTRVRAGASFPLPDAVARARGSVFIRLNYGMQRAAGGGMAVRNIACLPALTGDWRHPAGGVLLTASGSFAIDNAALERPDLLAGRQPRAINMSTIGDDLLRPASPGFAPIEAVIVYNSNPVAIAPESPKVAAGFARDDLFTVVLEHFRTDTADYADWVLPATTQLEHYDLHKTYGHAYALINEPAIAPLGEALSNTEIFRRLAARMGFDDACFAETDEQIARQAFDARHPRGRVDWAELDARGWVRAPGMAPAGGFAPFAEGGFGTPSGKCEFFCARMADAGLDPLPAYIAPYEVGNPEFTARFPLAVISPPARNFLNSSFVNVESLRATEGEPRLDIHPADAAARGIAEGDRVRVFNDRGSFTLAARVTDRARPGVVVALSVWWKKLAADGRNANEVVSQRLTDMGAGPVYYDCAVQVEKCA